MKRRILASLVALIALFALTACGGKDKNKDYYGTWNGFYIKGGSGDGADMAFERGVRFIQVVINEDGTLITSRAKEGDEPAKFENTDTGIKIDEGDGSVMELTYTDGILKGNLTSEGATTEFYLYKEGTEPSAKEKELFAKASVTVTKEGKMKFKDGGEEPPAEETTCGGKDKNKDYYGTWNVFYIKEGSGEDARDMAFERGVSGDALMQYVINEDGTMTTNMAEEGDEPAKFEIENTDTGIKIDEGDGSVMELTYTDGILKGNATSKGEPTEFYLYKEGTEPSAKEKELFAKASVTMTKEGKEKFKDDGEEPPAEETPAE